MTDTEKRLAWLEQWMVQIIDCKTGCAITDTTKRLAWLERKVVEILWDLDKRRVNISRVGGCEQYDARSEGTPGGLSVPRWRIICSIGLGTGQRLAVCATSAASRERARPKIAP
jgi:hypothetical protein